MAWFFGDSFDFYAAITDMPLNYWDSSAPASGNFTLGTGRFAGSRCIIANTAQTLLTKSSGANDTIHHFIFAFLQTAALSGATLGMYLQLLDGTTGQCCIVFRSDGAMLLTSGTPAGTVLATYTGAVNAQNTWTAFEVEIVVNNTTGSITVRKNGNTGTPDFTLGSLNTRVSGNNYANKLTIGTQGNITQHQLDDILWRSDAASVPWLGDIRAYQQMPASDVSDQFAGSPNPSIIVPYVTSSTVSKTSASGVIESFVAPYSGTISSGTISISAGGTGNARVAIYDSTRTTVLGASNAIVNPVAGANAVTFGTPVSVVKGTTYYWAAMQDFTLVWNCTGAASANTITTPYASFPAGSPSIGGAVQQLVFTLNLVPTNSSLVADPQQDGATSYVFDSTVGHADLYAMTPLASTPQSIVAVTMRGFMAKSDAGTRAGQLQLKSGATTVQSTPLFLSTSFLWNYRTDTVDPNTGLAWTAAAVNAAQIGPVVNT